MQREQYQEQSFMFEQHPRLDTQHYFQPYDVQGSIEEEQNYTNKNEHFQAELLRVQCYEKQKKAKKVFELESEELETYFEKQYSINEEVGFKMSHLFEEDHTKIIKDSHRIYFGEIVDHKKHGRGLTIYKDMRIYEGNYYNNQKEGPGMEIYANGNVYIGEYQKNRKHGNGKMYWFTLSSKDYFQQYEGEWFSGLPTGRGIHKRGNGDEYEGEFKNALKHGEGIQCFINGDVYVGEYVNGLPEGYGQYNWRDGSNYKGQFRQGSRNGFGVWRSSQNEQDCELYRGNYVLDKRSGYGMYIWTKGNFYQGSFYQDKKHGYGQIYHKDELLYAGMWLYGERAEYLNKQKDFRLYVDEQPERADSPPPPPVPQYKFEKNMEVQKKQLQKQVKIIRITPPKAKTKLDWERLNILAVKNGVPRKCNVKGCTPKTHWMHQTRLKDRW